MNRFQNRKRIIHHKKKQSKSSSKNNKSSKRKSVCLSRIQIELDRLNISELHDNNIKFILPNKNDLLTFNFEISPQSDSYWFGGKYLFQFSIPSNYPLIPPEIKCLTKIYHPNIDNQGRICLQILKSDQWSPTLNIEHILHHILNIFYHPNGTMYNNKDAGKEFNQNINKFKETVKQTLKGGDVNGVIYPKMIWNTSDIDFD